MFLLKHTISWEAMLSSPAEVHTALFAGGFLRLPFDPENEGRVFLQNTGDSQKTELLSGQHIQNVFNGWCTKHLMFIFWFLSCKRICCHL
jgi:hypothetical protein